MIGRSVEPQPQPALTVLPDEKNGAEATTATVSAYRITHWDVHENAEARRYKKLKWLAIPNNFDSTGWAFLGDSPHKQFLIGGWVVLLEYASRGPAGQREWLVRNGVPVSAKEIARVTRMTEKGIESALQFFSRPEIKWLEVVQIPNKPEQFVQFCEQFCADAAQKCPLPYHTLPNHTQVQKKGDGWVEETQVRWAAINKRIKELEGEGHELDLAGRNELRELRKELKVVEAQQRQGKKS